MIAAVAGFAVVLAPMIAACVYLVRRMNRFTAQAEQEATPFEPKTGRTTNALLRRFPGPERTYLRQQLVTAGIAYFVASWFFTAILSVSLLPHSRHATTWTDLSAFAWFQYVQSAASAVQLTLVFCSAAIAGAMLPLRQRPYAQFYRTRPLNSGFVFWARALPMLGVAIASTLNGAALSLALLAVMKGPVWRHLPSAFAGSVASYDDDRPQLYLALLATSLPRVFLSLSTTVTLLFGFFSALVTMPFNRWMGEASAARSLWIIVLGIVGVAAINAMDVIGILHVPPQLFFYSHLGPPPPWAFAAFPVLLGAGLLCSARFFTSRMEL